MTNRSNHQRSSRLKRASRTHEAFPNELAEENTLQTELLNKIIQLENKLDEKNKSADIMAAHCERIADAHNRISDITTNITILTVVLTLALGTIGYLSHEKAINESKSKVDEWFTKEKTHLEERLNNGVSKLLGDSELRIKQQEQEISDSHAKFLTAVNDKIQKINEPIVNNLLQQTLEKNQNEIQNSLKNIINTTDSSTNNNATNIYIKAFDFYYLQDYEKAIKAWEDVIQIDAKSSILSAKSLNNIGYSYEKMHKYPKAIEHYTNTIETFKISQNVDIKQQVAIALNAKGASLRKIGLTDEAIKTYNTAIDDYSNTSSKELTTVIADIHSNKGYALLFKKNYKESIESSSKALATYKELNTEQLRSSILNTIAQICEALVKDNRPEDALIEIDKAIIDYNNFKFKYTWEAPVPYAYSIKGSAQDALNRHKDAQKTYNEMVNKFKNSQDDETQSEVKRGLTEALSRANNRGDTTSISYYKHLLTNYDTKSSSSN